MKEITPNLARTHRLASTVGAFVTFVANGSPASEAGLRTGDVIVRIESSDVASLERIPRRDRGASTWSTASSSARAAAKS